MNEREREINIELPKKTHSELPAVESFSDPALAQEVWPEAISHNPEFLKQVESRKLLNHQLDEVVSLLPRPDMALEQAVTENYISEPQVAGLYASLAELIANPDYRRIILYLPFEFLPNKNWEPASDDLKQASERFKAAYLSAWTSLLKVHDVRENFVSGDVLEAESRTEDFPRVVKAAHLLPKLVETGLINPDNARKLMDGTDDEMLQRSITETLPVLADLGFINEDELPPLPDQPASEPPASVTEKRAAWLTQEKKRQTISAAGGEIRTALLDGSLDQTAVAQLFHEGIGQEKCEILIEGLRQTLESLAANDVDQARQLYSGYAGLLAEQWQLNQPQTHDALATTFYHLYGLGIIDGGQLHALDLAPPHLAGPFSENLKTMEKELAGIKETISRIENDPALARALYPAAILYGSRLKGYGAENSDLDLAVFIRPEISPNDKDAIHALVKKTFAEQNISGEVLEFWLRESNGDLTVDDLDQNDPLVGGRTWTHVLLGGAWEGSENVIKELREKLLAGYMRDNDPQARRLYLEELERDNLQYRLMHKGYEKFFPPRGGLNTPHSGLVDGHSAFWDSGYRQLATKLFASRVFIPKISQ